MSKFLFFKILFLNIFITIVLTEQTSNRAKRFISGFSPFGGGNFGCVVSVIIFGICKSGGLSANICPQKQPSILYFFHYFQKNILKGGKLYINGRFTKNLSETENEEMEKYIKELGEFKESAKTFIEQQKQQQTLSSGDTKRQQQPEPPKRVCKKLKRVRKNLRTL